METTEDGEHRHRRTDQEECEVPRRRLHPETQEVGNEERGVDGRDVGDGNPSIEPSIGSPDGKLSETARPIAVSTRCPEIASSLQPGPSFQRNRFVGGREPTPPEPLDASDRRPKFGVAVGSGDSPANALDVRERLHDLDGSWPDDHDE
jgi:hypothetical protein